MTKKVKQTIEMRTKDATKWLDALRSGKYKRATGTLFYPTGNDEDDSNQCGHCCLGVMQDVLGKVQKNGSGEARGLPTRRWLRDHKIKIVEASGTIGDIGEGSEADIALDPPYQTANGSSYGSVADLNDSNHFTFKQIAKILDKRIKRV